MKTLSEYNKRNIEIKLEETDNYKTNLECDECGYELFYDDPHLILLSNPPKQSVHCDNCGFKGYIQL